MTKHKRGNVKKATWYDVAFKLSAVVQRSGKRDKWWKWEDG
ncbi:hypothetical protein [Sphingobacterium sp. UGAL515B_05]|nr:hypothetical protein [Sphingobacterium sp. UGAL515B_05]WON95123.1 hypothetical protein OK025_01615 [Sphingobacterium sp. UGAL515B_05]